MRLRLADAEVGRPRTTLRKLRGRSRTKSRGPGGIALPGSAPDGLGKRPSHRPDRAAQRFGRFAPTQTRPLRLTGVAAGPPSREPVFGGNAGAMRGGRSDSLTKREHFSFETEKPGNGPPSFANAGVAVVSISGIGGLGEAGFFRLGFRRAYSCSGEMPLRSCRFCIAAKRFSRFPVHESPTNYQSLVEESHDVPHSARPGGRPISA